MTDVLHIYADGSFDAATRAGGWAFVVMHDDHQIQVAAGAMTGASNNSIEVFSVIQALYWLEREAPTAAATLWTDSAHVVEGCSRWRFIWRSNGWKRVRANSHERRRTIPDAEMWRQLDGLLERNPKVRIQLCKGHAGVAGNERADAAARAALERM
jgi:ribonuclease HI